MIKYTFEKREDKGKKNKSLRRAGITPCVMYNAKGESYSIQIKNSELQQMLKSSTSSDIITISLDGKDHNVIVKDVETHPITDDFIHVSFLEIIPNTTVDVNVQFTTVGISPAVKNNLGVLIQPLSSIVLRCPSDKIPQSITIDISNLEHAGQTILVGDIELPEGVKLIHKEDATKPIITITAVQKQEVVETTTEEGTEVEESEETTQSEETEETV
jgi:large subunit ribosomal protein L25